MKMDHLTTTQLIKIIKTHYKNGDSVTATYRALRGGCQAIDKTVKKFEET